MEENYAQLWQKLSAALKPQVSPDTFKRWFSAVKLVQATDDAFTFRVPNNIYQFWIESNHMAALQAAIVTAFGAPRKVKFSSASEGPENGESLSEIPGKEFARENCPGRQAIQQRARAQSAEQFRIVRRRPEQRDRPCGESRGRASHRRAPTTRSSFTAASGSGKTHLMQAIGQHVGMNKKNAKVMYLSSELFINEFIDAIQHNNLVKFRKRYRQADLLLIDDIQFLGGKERSQEEFFHTFNTLFDGHKQIVLSSDRPPSEIANLEHRLVSRFEWGLTAELQPPDVETRMAILRKKAHTLGIKLRDETFDFLATRIRTNVRRLEGALMRVASFASLSGKELTNEVVEHLLKDILQEEARHAVTIEQIQRRVAEHYDVRLADMTSKRRPANIAFPRQIAMYLARELTKASLNEIGDAFGGRDHGTVLHACKLVKRRMQEQDNIRQTISFIDSALQR